MRARVDVLLLPPQDKHGPVVERWPRRKRLRKRGQPNSVSVPGGGFGNPAPIHKMTAIREKEEFASQEEDRVNDARKGEISFLKILKQQITEKPAILLLPAHTTMFSLIFGCNPDCLPSLIRVAIQMK